MADAWSNDPDRTTRREAVPVRPGDGWCGQPWCVTPVPHAWHECLRAPATPVAAGGELSLEQRLLADLARARGLTLQQVRQAYGVPEWAAAP